MKPETADSSSPIPHARAIEPSEGPADEPVIDLKDLAVARGGHTVWSKGTFSIPTGAVVGVIGPNGSGKTTLLEMIVGSIPPAEGTLRVLGAPPRRGNPRIGYVPQNYATQVASSVRAGDLVRLGVAGTRWGLGPLSAKEDDAIEQAVEAVDAAHLIDKRVSDLSGGQQQRIAIAQALVGNPDLLLLDEPLANLDMRKQHEVVQLLGNLIEKNPKLTILIVAHDLNPLLTILTGAIYLLDDHAHYDEIGKVVDEELLSHLYGTAVRVVKTPQGDLFTRNA